MQPNTINSNNDGFVPDSPASDDGFVADGFVPDQRGQEQPQGKPQDWLSKYGYTPLIESGAMGIGGTAAGLMAAPAGPIAAGAAGVAGGMAMLPPAKRFAASIDQMRGIDNPVNHPKPLFDQAKDVVSDLGEGAAYEAGGRMINAGAEVAAPYAKSIFRGAAGKMAKLGQTISGAPAKDLMTAYDQGLVKTYGAPGMKEAGSIFDKAATDAGAKVEPTVDQIIDPDLSQARDTARTLASKLRSGEKLTAQEALSGRQALDYIKEATPFWQRKKLFGLGQLRDEFQSAISDLSPELQDASKTYHQAKVKSTLLSPMRINKRGDYSAIMPMLSGIGGALTSASQHSPEALLAGGATVLGTSPLASGVTAAASGDATRAIGSILSSPTGGKAIASAVGNKILDESKAREYLKKAGGDKDKARQMAKADGWNF